jgi:hypothetical protein
MNKHEMKLMADKILSAGKKKTKGKIRHEISDRLLTCKVENTLTAGPKLKEFAVSPNGIPGARTDAQLMNKAVSALKDLSFSFKRKIRQAVARATAEAVKAAELAEAEVDANENARQSERDKLNSRAYVLRALADDMAGTTDERGESSGRKGWAWQDEIEDLLEPRELVFIGMEIKNGEWVGGYWKGDWEARSTRKAETKVDRRYVDYESVDRIMARQLYNLESAIEGKTETEKRDICYEFEQQWTIGKKRPETEEE